MLITILIILLSFYLIFYSGKRVLDIRVERERKVLRSLSVVLSGKTYDEDQLMGLPEPVQSYFKYALKNGQPYVSSVHLRHDGRFKTALDREWINIEGEQHFSTEEPGFLWKGRTSLFVVRDMYLSGKGQIKVTLLNLIKVMDGKGPEYDQGELLRWLGESVWFPTNLLPSSRLKWTALNDEEAELTFCYRDQILSYRVSFNLMGEITQLETRRYMGEGCLETWIGRVSDYEVINGMKIPMKIEALWKLPDGEHSYAQFIVRDLHHK